jgi:hypothetical protein
MIRWLAFLFLEGFMDTLTAGDTGTDETSSPNYDTLADKIGEQLFDQTGPREEPDDLADDTSTPEGAAAPAQPSTLATTTPTPESVAEPAPKSWPKEMHDHWGKTPKEVQTYWQTREKQMLDGIEQYKQAAHYGKSLSDVLAPYHPLLQSKGLDAPRAVADLMQAYTAMTQGTPEQRRTAYEQIGKNLGITLAPQGEASVPLDPRIEAMQSQFQQMQQTITAQQTEALNAAREKAGQEVEKFASDPANIYFNELQDDILNELKAGYDLPTAYKRAVRANDVTFNKEIARTQTETEAKLKENARLQALPKKQAKSVNIGGRDSHVGLTEPLGTLEETIRAERSKMVSRVSH